MKIILFGATGMVGQGVLRECLLAPDVERVVVVGRSASGKQHDKLREVVHADLLDFFASAPIEKEIAGSDACFFCLGVSASGMNEADYTRLTYDLTLSVATTLSRLCPQMTFIYVSGAGTDSSERGRTMWARVKGKTENALLKLPFKAVYLFRPGMIQPMHGEVSKTPLYRTIYTVMGPALPVFRKLLPGQATTTEHVGRAMLRAARQGAPRAILGNRDINELGQ